MNIAMNLKTSVFKLKSNVFLKEDITFHRQEEV